MRHYGRLLIALLIVILILPAVFGNSVSLAGGRTFSTSGPGVVHGVITSYGTTGATGATFKIPPGTGTISNALSNAADNDILLLEKGTYFDNVLIDKSLSITGAGATLTNVDGLHKGSVFTITSGVTTTLADMMIQNGQNVNGGGIFNGGTINLNNILITGNTAIYGGGIYNAGTVTMSGGTISDNLANNGGGILNHGTVTMNSGSTITGNTAFNGGGILNYGTVTMNSNSSITDNTGYTNGGGVYNIGTITVNSGSSITGNIGQDGGGGIYNTGTIKMNGGTISNNKPDNVYP